MLNSLTHTHTHFNTRILIKPVTSFLQLKPIAFVRNGRRYLYRTLILILIFFFNTQKKKKKKTRKEIHFVNMYSMVEL